MRWRSRRQSSNIEDRRGMDAGGGFPGGMRMPGRIGIPGGRRAGVGGFGLIAVIVIAVLIGFDPSQMLQTGPGGTPAYVPQGPTGAAEEELKQFVSVVLAETEDTWHQEFRKLGATYEEPKLVLFAGAIDSACGYAESAMGPFYCPGDHFAVCRHPKADRAKGEESFAPPQVQPPSRRSSPLPHVSRRDTTGLNGSARRPIGSSPCAPAAIPC